MCEFMKQALLQARIAKKQGEVPVGAVIVKDGEIISRAYNTREKTQNALCHAEMLAIEKACKKLHSFRLTDCALYVTLEPCPMCTGAIINARVGQVFVGCQDKDFGCCGGKINIANGDFGFAPQVKFGIMERECKTLLDSFFEEIREKNRLKKLLGKTIDVCFVGEKMLYTNDSDKIECILGTFPQKDINLDKELLVDKTKETNCVDNNFMDKTTNLCKNNKLNFNKEASFDVGNSQNVRDKNFGGTQQKVFAIVDELMTGKIYFLCKNFDGNERFLLLKNLKLKGRIKIFEVGKEPIILDIKNLTRGAKATNI